MKKFCLMMVIVCIVFSCSLFDKTAPGPVTNLDVSETGTMTAQLTWTDPVDSDLKSIEISNNADNQTNSINSGIEKFNVDLDLYNVTYTADFTATDTAGNQSETAGICFYMYEHKQKTDWITHYSYPDPIAYITYQYDDDGNLIEKGTYFYSNDVLYERYDYEYDSDDQLIRREHYQIDTSDSALPLVLLDIAEYDYEDGYHTKTSYYNASMERTSISEITERTQTYNLISKMAYYDASNQPDGTAELRYNDVNDLTAMIFYDNNGQETSRKTYTYDSDRLNTEIRGTVVADSTQDYSYDNSFSSDGLLTSEITRRHDDSLIQQYDHFYESSSSSRSLGASPKASIAAHDMMILELIENR